MIWVNKVKKRQIVNKIKTLMIHINKIMKHKLQYMINKNKNH